MTSVAEYLGKDVRNEEDIEPVEMRSGAACPFMIGACTKVAQGYEPVCSVRDAHGELWMVCRNRLCGTKKTLPLSDYQKAILLEIAKYVYADAAPSKIGVKREETVRHSTGKYSADYVMRLDEDIETHGPHAMILEMQGGGETTNTGKITRHIRDVWKQSENRDNRLLAKEISAVGTLATNAWRRQQEQLVVKGKVAIQAGGGITIAMGTLLFDYVSARFEEAIPLSHTLDEYEPDWNVALVAFQEVSSHGIAPARTGSIPIRIDPARTVHTTYAKLMAALTAEADLEDASSVFEGEYTRLS